jgi:hypothetical protein
VSGTQSARPDSVVNPVPYASAEGASNDASSDSPPR